MTERRRRSGFYSSQTLKVGLCGGVAMLLADALVIPRYPGLVALLGAPFIKVIAVGIGVGVGVLLFMGIRRQG